MKKLVYENPFYGLKSLFALFQNGVKGSIVKYLDAARREAGDNNMFIQLFHIICFSLGDITNRQHNIFKSKVDSGGNAANPQWIEYVSWLINAEPKTFVKFLPLIVEYVGLRELVTLQIKTNKKSITGVWGLLNIIQNNPIAYTGLIKLLAKYIRGNNPFMKHQVAKFVHIPRSSARIAKKKDGTVTGKRQLQNRTKDKMKCYHRLVLDLSKEMEWLVDVKENYTAFVGYKEWQKQYNQNLEFVLFSTGKIAEFDKEQFVNWINTLPSGARYRVRRRLLDGDDKPKTKWTNLSKWFLDWEKSKLKLQQEKRILEAKASTVGLSDNEKAQLAKVTKDAKVTVGATSLFSYLEQFLQGKATDVTIQAILDKVEFNVPLLPIVDCSGSMNGRPMQIARLLTTLALLKNPNKMDNLLFRFGTATDCITDQSTALTSNNRFMGKQSVVVSKLVDREADFQTNFNSVGAFVNASMGSTNFTGIAENIRKWVDSSTSEVEKAHRREQVSDYQVMLVISDGDLNNSHSAAASMADFQMKMRQWFSWDGVIVLWDVPKLGDSVNKSGYFDNIENVIHICTYNMSTINQVFTKISDMDVIDIYTPLKSLYQSNRYDLVREMCS